MFGIVGGMSDQIEALERKVKELERRQVVIKYASYVVMWLCNCDY